MGNDLPPHPHNPVNIVFILSCVGCFILTIVFNALGGSGAGSPDLFYNVSIGDISDKYQVFIVPAGFTFAIWSIIYLWLAASLIILTVTIFINTEHGRLYLSPAIATPAVTATLSINFILNTAWIFIWNRSYVNPDLTILSSICLFLVAITNILAMVFMAKNIGDNTAIFSRGSPLFRWGVVYRVILNGLGMYTTWTVIASLVNMTSALVFAGQVDQREAALAALSLLVIFHCTWFVVENWLVDFYARYLLTPYIVVIWASNGIRAKKMDDPDVPQDVKDFVLAILIIAILTFLVRLSLVIYRTVKKPLTHMSPLA